MAYSRQFGRRTPWPSVEARPVAQRPMVVSTAMALALISGFFTFLVSLRLLHTNGLNSLIGRAYAMLPFSIPPQFNPTHSQFPFWTPALIGLFVLLAYILSAVRLYVRHPLAVATVVVLGALFVLFSLLDIREGGVSPAALVIFVLNVLLLAFVLSPSSRAYLR